MSLSKLSKSQAEAIGPEFEELYALAKMQLEEHKRWLQLRLRELNPRAYLLTSAQLAQLEAEVSLIKLDVVKVEPVGAVNRVSTTISYPDALHAFLSRPDVPDSINLSKTGGVTLEASSPVRRV